MRVDIPANLANPCAKLTELEGNTGKHLLPWAVDTVEKYNDCAKRHEALVRAWGK